MENNSNPLVSIIVITYNSAKYVLETLESAKDQTYKNIELIVSDDGSTDNTVEICREWINNNKVRFVRTELIDHPINTGIPANCNRGVKASNGEWIKLIAGDDLLLPNCISDNIDFCKNSKSKIFCSIKITFIEKNNHRVLLEKSNSSIFNLKKITADEQYQLVLRNRGCTPNTLFIHRLVFEKVNGFDEEFPLVEDRPFLLRVTKKGYKIDYLPVETVLYRKHENSIFNLGRQEYIYPQITKTYYLIDKKYILQEITLVEKLFFWYRYFITHFFLSTILNKRILFNRIIEKLLFMLPTLYKNYMIKKLKTKILSREVI